MKPYSSSASLKRLAKGQLIGNYSTAVSITLIHMLCAYFLSLFVRVLIGQGTLFQDLLYLCAAFFVTVFSGFFVAGEAYVYLKLACHQPIFVKDLFYCFQEEAARVLPLQAALSGINLIFALPVTLMEYLPVSFPAPLSLSVLLLFYAGVTFLLLMFSQIFYLMLDFPDYSAGRLLKASIQLMKGSKGRLFYIQLSFLPLLVLGLLSCCVGLLWVYPFYQATLANFYLDIVKKQQSR